MTNYSYEQSAAQGTYIHNNILAEMLREMWKKYKKQIAKINSIIQNS